MRADGNEPIIELNFDCGASGALKRTDVGGMTYVRHEVLTANVLRTATGYINVPQGMNALCINLKGTLIARAGVQGRLVLCPPRSLTYIRGTRLIVQAARGEHHSVLLSWQSNVTSLLDAWIQSRHVRNAVGPQRTVACKPIDPHFKGAIERFERAVANPSEILEPMVVSVIYEIVSRLMIGMDQVQLAAVPTDLPETIKELVVEVRGNPAAGWPLKEAASKAGYSPFHFSRVFKNLVGYGFHEYVDRCRTECSVEMLVTTDHAVDLVASTCGFGTTQGLRESVKEYLGLVPSELRAIPEDPGDNL
ncbi:helix-turn-helix transcriptional regulator [Fimbriimonas ginsengisoli]|uniref:Transcriptional regulatory protein n=1 Tax=Fimbriimonas ginsengisoli Gsoil 348 TaxID=661478 RepID=A0A068NM58_FIMGI|nr:helix-turn-helix transcriptional regulator [Fimbriimonas ginsengisoli]AIE83870.1 transcriptional regulatory protein [Fimbriimonas ginsengisoli Gsoil 348]